MTNSFLVALRSMKIIILTKIVATTAPDKHATSVRTSCGLPSVETLGTEIKTKEEKKHTQMLLTKENKCKNYYLCIHSA